MHRIQDIVRWEQATAWCRQVRLRARVRVGVAAWLVLAAGLWVGSTPARAEGTVTTNSTTALLQALLGGGRVQLTFAETLTLEIPVLIAADTILEGAVPGGRLATLSGGGLRRPFHVLPGIRFEILNCVIREGRSTNGGGLFNEGTLVMSNVVLAGCQAIGADGEDGRAGEDRFGLGENGGGGKPGWPAYGGALYNAGDAVIVNSIFTENRAQGGGGGDGGDGGTGAWGNGIGGDGAPGALAYGGAIHGVTTSRLAITNTLFANNVVKAGDGGAGGSDSSVLGSGHGSHGATAAGGAIHTEGWLWVVRSTFATNSVTAGKAAPAGAPSFINGRNGEPGGHAWGGALAAWSTGAVINSTFVTNAVVGGAGGAGAAGNFTAGRGGAGGDGLGGAIHGRGSLGLTNLTLAWNGVTNGIGGGGGTSDPGTNGVGGIFIPGTAGPNGRAGGSGIAAEGDGVNLVNSIVVAAGGVPTLNGGVRDLGHNLYSDRGTGDTVTGSIYDADPQFTEFKVWLSGTTPGFLLQAGSPAIDSGDPEVSLAEDQRALPRPAGLGPDIGSMEAGASSFFIRGSVLVGSGTEGVPGVGLEVGALRSTTDSLGRFQFGPLPTGFYTVAIAGGGIGYTPRLVQIPLVADATNVVFRTAPLRLTYQPGNPISAEGSVSSVGMPGRPYRLEGSQDLRTWESLGTVQSDSQGRMEFRHAPGSEPMLFYRIVEE